MSELNNAMPKIGAQEAVIGAMLLKPEICTAVFRQVSEQHFTDPTCKNIFVVIRNLIQRGKRVDAVVVLGELGSQEYRSYISSLIDNTPTAAGWQEYADIMRRDAQAHYARQAFSRGLYAKTEDEMRQCINELAGIFAKPSTAAVSLSDALAAAYDEIDREPHYLQFGIESLDDGRVFAEYGDFIVIGARPSVGKTALALQFARSISRSDKVGFFSFETGVSKLATRWISASAHIYLTHLKTRELSDGELRAMAQASGHDTKYCNIEFIQAAGMGIGDVIAQSIANEYRVIFIDYLQLIRGNGETDENTRVANISMALHRFSQETGTTVIALSQLSRAGKTGADMSSLRGSGQIEQDADIVFLLELENAADFESPRILSIEKNKEGRRGYCRLRFDGGHQKFEYIPQSPQRAQQSKDRPKIATPEQMEIPQAIATRHKRAGNATI